MLRLRIVYTGPPGSPYYTNLYFGGNTSGEADAARDAVAAFQTALASTMRNDTVMTLSQDAPRIDPATGDILEMFSVSPSVVNGSTAGARQSTALQGLIRWRTGEFFGGREIRGRTFLPGTVDAADNDGVPSASYQNDVADAVNAFLPAAGPAGTFGVWSRTNGTFAAADTYSVWNQWAVLRSRR